MWTCNRSELQTLGSQQVVMPKNVPNNNWYWVWECNKNFSWGVMCKMEIESHLVRSSSEQASKREWSGSGTYHGAISTCHKYQMDTLYRGTIRFFTDNNQLSPLHLPCPLVTNLCGVCQSRSHDSSPVLASAWVPPNIILYSHYGFLAKMSLPSPNLLSSINRPKP